MKQLLLGLILTFGTYTSVVADDPSNCVHCKTNLRGEPSKSMGGAGKIMRAVAEVQDEKIKLKVLAGRICYLYSQSGQIPKDTKKLISDYMTSNDYSQPTLANMIKFLNHNKNNLQCSGRSFIKEAINQRVYKPMVYSLLTSEFDTGDEYINFNAIDVVDGKPETIVDYMDYIIANGEKRGEQYIKEVSELRDYLMDEEDGFAAKRFKDLPQDEQELWRKKAIQQTK